MSFNIGLSGLRATNEELGVISQNIANVNTAGFKSGRAEFAAVYSAGAPSGVEVASVSQNFERNGSVINTGRSLDLALTGRGFFMLSNNNEVSYTRAGNFNRDADNFIVANDGSRLQGYPVDANGGLLSGVVSDLKVGTGSLPAQASTQVNFAANLKSDAPQPTTNPFDHTDINTYNYSQSGKVYDSQGKEHVLTQYFEKTGGNTWNVHYFVNGQASGSEPMSFDANGQITAPTGKINVGYLPTDAAPMSIDISYKDMSQNASDFNLSRNETDGYGAGELKTIRIDDDGSLYGVYTNGQDKLQGKVVLADFTNPEGLRIGNNSTYKQGFESGAPLIGEPNTGTLGNLTAGAFEGSNVDLTGELVNLMTAQRNYQANAKTISAAEQMTKVLFNSF